MRIFALSNVSSAKDVTEMYEAIEKAKGAFVDAQNRKTEYLRAETNFEGKWNDKRRKNDESYFL